MKLLLIMDKMKLSKNLEIAYKISGNPNGPKMVLIHDLFLNNEVWKFQTKYFENHFQILSYDLRGHGKSTKKDESFTIRSHVNDLEKLLDHLEWISNIFLIGHSLGGMIAMIYCLENQEKVERLVISNSFCYVSQESIENLLESISCNPLENFCKLIIAKGLMPFDDEIANFLNKKIIDNMDKKDCLNAAASLSGFRICNDLKHLNTPSLIIIGEHDKIHPSWASEMMHSWINDSNLVIFSKAGHHLNLNHSNEFNELLLKFWNERMSEITGI